MEARPLGRCGLRVSALGLGAMTFGESRTFMRGVTSDDKEAKRVFDRAIERGVNFIDTANVYSEGQSERLVGQWIKDRRDRVILATKCRFAMGFDESVAGPHGHGLSRKHIIEACEASLKRLGTDRVDLYQVHMQDTSVPIDETLGALDDLVTQGKVLYVGCSNYTGYRLVESLWSADANHTHRFESVQLQWSLAVRDAEREVVPAARAFGLGMLVWSPLARGFLTGKYKRGERVPEGSRLAAWPDTLKQYDNERGWAIVSALGEIAERHDSTPAAVAIAWLLSREGVSSVIVGARTEEQLEQNCEALELRLEPVDLKALDEVTRPEWGYPYGFIGGRQSW